VHESGVMSHRFVLLTIVSAWLVWSLASPAEAQRASATILRTHGSEGVPEATARGFDRVLRQRLDALDVVDIAGSVELDLEAVQLALGCMGESVECLRSAATQAEAEVLVYASIERAGTTVVSVMRFDATSGTLRRAVRTVDSDAAVLASADPIVRELWDVAVIDTPPPLEAPPPRATSVSPWPLVLAGTGGAALIAGGVLAGVGASSASEFVALRPGSEQEVDAARRTLERAQTEQTAGGVLLVAGAAMAIGGVVWALAGGNDDGTSPLAVIPVVSPAGAALVLSGTIPNGGL
jgi:hypothetical protein